jgi:acyl carrier protein
MNTSPAEDKVFSILAEFAEEWGLDDLEIGSDTRLKADMSFESADIMQLFLGIQEAFPYVTLRFQSLIMSDGKFVEDLTAREVIVFVNTEIAKSLSVA